MYVAGKTRSVYVFVVNILVPGIFLFTLLHGVGLLVSRK